MPREWFKFQMKGAVAAQDSADVKVSGQTAEIYIIDWIGDWVDDARNRFWGEDIGVTARAFIDQLNALPADVVAVDLHINSPGGDVQAGVNIANALRQWAAKGRTVNTYVDGIAASIASVIAMAGTKVHMADNALMMVHSPWADVTGNANELRKMADVLDTVEGQIIASYKWHTSLDDAAIKALLDEETYLDAAQALEMGFATDVVQGLKAAASISRQAAAKLNIPEKHRARVDAFLQPKPAESEAPKAMAARDVIAACQKAGHGLDLADALLAAGATEAHVADAIQKATTARTQATERATEIRALCKAAKLPNLADGYIAGNMGLDAIRAHLTYITGTMDKHEIDTTIVPGQEAKGKAKIMVMDVYRERAAVAQGLRQ